MDWQEEPMEIVEEPAEKPSEEEQKIIDEASKKEETPEEELPEVDSVEEIPKGKESKYGI